MRNWPRGKRKDLEAETQKEFFQYLHFLWPLVRPFAFAIPNGGLRHPAVALELKRQGVTPGVPDVFIALPSKEYHGLWIEFKFGKNKPTPKQKEMLARLTAQNYLCVVCYSSASAIEILTHYLQGSKYVPVQSIQERNSPTSIKRNATLLKGRRRINNSDNGA